MRLHNTLQGKYKLAVTRKDGSIEETPWFHNTILDQGLDRIGSAASQTIVGYAQVGTGNTPPATTQTSLQSYLAGGGSGSPYPTSIVNVGSPTYAAVWTWALQFAQGAVVGTISEVGVGWEQTSGSNLFSRELIRDGGGNPITLSLTSFDQLTVYYELTVTPTVTDYTGSVVLDSITYNYTSRLLSASSFAAAVGAAIGQRLGAFQSFDTYTYANAALVPITDNSPTGDFISAGSVTSANVLSYIPGSYYNDTTLFWDVDKANDPAGITGIVPNNGFGNAVRYQIIFGTPIPKTNTKTLSLTIRGSWSRA